MRNTYIFILGILVIFGCNGSDKELTRPEIESIASQNLESLRRTLLSGKVDSVMSFYDEEAILSPDGFPEVRGRENIKAFLGRGMKMAKYTKLELKAEHVNGTRDFIYQSGLTSGQMIVYDSLALDQADKFFYLWKLQNDGSYKIAAEIHNTVNEDED